MAVEAVGSLKLVWVMGRRKEFIPLVENQPQPFRQYPVSLIMKMVIMITIVITENTFLGDVS
jgi:hypothetical protein